MLTIEYAKDCVWNDANNSAINMIVKFEEMAEEMPFLATPNDVMPYGVELFDNAVAGDYGPVAPYIAPIPTAEQNKAMASQLLYETDWTTESAVADPQLSNPYLMNQNEFFQYRSVLREIATNPTVGNLQWPQKPKDVWSN